MTYAELLESHEKQKLQLAEKHLQEWQNYKAENKQQGQSGASTPNAQQEMSDRLDAFRNRQGKEIRELESKQITEAEQLNKSHGTIKEGKANSQWLENEEKNRPSKEELMKQQQAEVKQEYEQVKKEAAKEERQEQYNQQNLPNSNDMEPAAQKRQAFLDQAKKPEQERQAPQKTSGTEKTGKELAPEADRDRKRREFKETMAATKKQPQKGPERD